MMRRFSHRRFPFVAAAALFLPAGIGAQSPEPETAPPDVEYTIEATLDESTDVLHGRARLVYTNNSPLTLDSLYFQQYLNAFRPNSAWARTDLEAGRRDFQELGPEEHAFERLTRVAVAGEAVQPVYPGAPDSTVVAIPLASPLGSGETVTVELDWDARLSTLPRRQGREGRHYDFAQWYPRIAVVQGDGWKYNPLIRAGEFYGEFASWDVTLDLADDQVIGATGVPVEGDPLWDQVVAEGFEVAPLHRDAFGTPSAASLGLLEDEAADGRRRIRFRADSVHHFAWSVSPAYIYEGGTWQDDVSVHVLYRPGDDDWDDGVALERTYEALDFFADVFAPYPYPQVTNLHRLESGGTEFPMVIMDGSASLGLIVHEIAHQYAHGILANNEWREAWLDEGMASFLGTLFAESGGAEDPWRQTAEGLAELQRMRQTEPVSQHAADFSSYEAYRDMSYSMGSAFLWMLREYLGEETFAEGLRRYYRDNAFAHVTEHDIRRAMEAVSGEDLTWFFDQWLHTTDRLDYSVGSASTRQLADGSWQTRLVVRRQGDAWMPVTLRVNGAERTLDSRERRQVVTVTTPERPREAVLDPDYTFLDFDRTNNAVDLAADGS